MSDESQAVKRPEEYIYGDIYGWYPMFKGETTKECEIRIKSYGTPEQANMEPIEKKEEPTEDFKYSEEPDIMRVEERYGCGIRSYDELQEFSRRKEENQPIHPFGFNSNQKKEPTTMRTFDSGATRDGEDGKLDYEGILSPQALKRYAEYMNRHRKQSDGNMRASDNWQKGIPLNVYMKSLWRHFMEVWTLHRKIPNLLYLKNPSVGLREVQEDALCALIFNAFGYLHEIKKAQEEIRDEN